MRRAQPVWHRAAPLTGAGGRGALLPARQLADTHLSIRTWLQVVCLMCSSWGISAHALHRRLDIRSYKTARRVCERIKYAKHEPPLVEMLAQAREAEGLDSTLPPELIEMQQSYGASIRKNKRRCRGPTGRLSLFPLTFDDALRGLLLVPPMGRRPTKVRPTKTKTRPVDEQQLSCRRSGSSCR
jgi:hypothetical protein